MSDHSITAILDALQRVASRIEKLETLVSAKFTANASPYLNGDTEAAHYIGFKDARTFQAWARKKRLRPVYSGRRRIWEKRAIHRAFNPEADY